MKILGNIFFSERIFYRKQSLGAPGLPKYLFREGNISHNFRIVFLPHTNTVIYWNRTVVLSQSLGYPLGDRFRRFGNPIL